MIRNLWARWLVLARKIGDFQSRVLLTLFYFLIITPFGLAVRVFGDPLHLRHDSQQTSEWLPRETADIDLDAAHHQY
ncbi:MAG: hypothetical protein U9R25_11755 [Chloroflexota bacterium]|nr:hypothetical protein [Chloroflexota bacterium]